MANLEPKRIAYKYDLMHLNTPSFASATVTWDTAKLTKITMNRVMKALQTGFMPYRSGEAAAMYGELRKKFEIPRFVLQKPKRSKNGDYWNGNIEWEFATERLNYALQQIYVVERVNRRLEGKYIPWYMESEKLDLNNTSYLWLEMDHDLTEVEAAINEIIHSDEVKDKREQAMRFVEQGGKLTFTWRE